MNRGTGPTQNRIPNLGTRTSADLLQFFLDTLDCTTQNLSFMLQVRQLAKLEADGTEVTQRRLGSGVHKNV